MSNQDKLRQEYKELKELKDKLEANSVGGYGVQMEGTAGELTDPDGPEIWPGLARDYNGDPNKVLQVLQQPMVNVEVTGPNSVSYEFLNIPTDQACQIVTEVLPGALELFLQKNRDYGDEHVGIYRLGPKAQFIDIWRKVAKLKRSLWDGKQLQGEQPEEIFKDFVGHALLALLDFHQARTEVK